MPARQREPHLPKVTGHDWCKAMGAGTYGSPGRTQHAVLKGSAAQANVCSLAVTGSLSAAHAAAAAGPCSDAGERRGAHLLPARPLLALLLLQAAMLLPAPGSGRWAPQLMAPVRCLKQPHAPWVLVCAAAASLERLLLVRVPVPCWRSRIIALRSALLKHLLPLMAAARRWGQDLMVDSPENLPVKNLQPGTAPLLVSVVALRQVRCPEERLQGHYWRGPAPGTLRRPALAEQQGGAEL